MANLLEVQDLETVFKTRTGTIHAVNGISFSVKEGEVLGIVGESGCGKSVTMLSLMRLIPSPPGKIVAGKAMYQDKDLVKISEDEMRSIRGAQISMVFQDPMTSLNPVLKIGKQIAEPLIFHLGMSKKEARDYSTELLHHVGIPEPERRLDDYPHQFSGGMRQRVMIAMALTCNPKLLIADEPTTALDVTIQAQIVELVKRLRDESNMAIIWITHDLGIVSNLATRVVVMYAGFIIEEAAVKELYANPLHPYTRGLLGSLPRLDKRSNQRLVSIEGLPPTLQEKPKYCPFSPRCQYSDRDNFCENPKLVQVGPEHRVACWIDVTTGKVR